MKGRLIIFVALLFSRVFITPVCFGMHADEVKNPTDSFEQVRLKKRRSSYLEEEYSHDSAIGIMTKVVVAAKRVRILKRLHNRIFPILRPSFQAPSYAIAAPLATALFLINRVLRI